jgi:hypothetical protein
MTERKAKAIRADIKAGLPSVEIARKRLTIDKVLTEKAFENAMRVLLAIGGSTNAVVHLLAIAGRLGVKLSLEVCGGGVGWGGGGGVGGIADVGEGGRIDKLSSGMAARGALLLRVYSNMRAHEHRAHARIE